MNLPGIIAISVLIILIGSLLVPYLLAMKSRTRREPTYLKDDFAVRVKQKGISDANSIFWILLLFLTVVIVMGM